MAKSKIIFINESENEIHFSLSNNTKYRCKMDLDKYLELVEGKTCYYVKECKKKGRVASFAIARCESSTGKTIFLHWDVIGFECRAGSNEVIDHENRNPADNRIINLRKITHIANLNNSEHKIRVFDCGFVKPNNVSVTYLKARGFHQIYYNGNGKPKYVGCNKDINKIPSIIKKYWAANGL